MSTAQVGCTGTIHLLGEVAGALYFGRLADKLGRRGLYILTLAIYLVGSGIGGLAPAMWFLWIFRFVAGLGIGRVDIAVNGTYWAGAAIGTTANLFLLADPGFANSWGLRIGFFSGPFLGLIIIYLRRHIPESPPLADDAWEGEGGRSDR